MELMNELYFIDYEAKTILADTVGMQRDTELAHRRLCDMIWFDGRPLTNDDARLREICRVELKDWARVKGELMQKGWIIDGGFFTHKGTMKTLERCKERYRKQLEASKLGVEARIKLGQIKPPDEPMVIPAVNQPLQPRLTQSQSQSQSQSSSNSSFDALKLANRILSNEGGWDYDNCKVKPDMFNSRSLRSVIEPFIGKKTDDEILRAWNKAVKTTHASKVDGLAKNAAAYAIQCFKNNLNGRDKDLEGRN